MRQKLENCLVFKTFKSLSISVPLYPDLYFQLNLHTLTKTYTYMVNTLGNILENKIFYKVKQYRTSIIASITHQVKLR